MLRMLKMESSAFPGRVLFPTGFAPRGMSQGFKDVVAPPAKLALAGVEVGGGKGVSLKTLEGIEKLGDCESDLSCEPKGGRVMSTEGVGVESLKVPEAHTSWHAAAWRTSVVMAHIFCSCRK
jgi:hypothetical protein